MKFNLNITDMNEEEFAKLFANINCNPTIQPVLVTKVEEEPVEQPVEDPIIADVDGLQWDARIHSSNHKINSDGRWQRRRGISDEEFNRVKNELLGVQEPVTPAQPEIVPPVTVAQTPMGEYSAVAPIAPVVAPAPIPAPIVPTPAAPVAPIAPEPTPVIDSAVLYQTMFEKIKVALNNGKFKANDVQNLVAAINAQFGTQYQSLYLIKDNIDALQFVINDLTARGL